VYIFIGVSCLVKVWIASLCTAFGSMILASIPPPSLIAQPTELLPHYGFLLVIVSFVAAVATGFSSQLFHLPRLASWRMAGYAAANSEAAKNSP